jgi:hypothetical protein
MLYSKTICIVASSSISNDDNSQMPGAELIHSLSASGTMEYAILCEKKNIVTFWGRKLKVYFFRRLTSILLFVHWQVRLNNN